MMRSRAVFQVLLLMAWIVVIAPGPGAAQWLELEVPERPAEGAAGADAGREIFEDRCWFCHGEDGDGEGPIADYLWPRPRDFTLASFKLRTTASGELPTDEDLFRTITLGIAGTSMPAWGGLLSEQELWQVISYIKTFSDGLFDDEAFDPYQAIFEIGDAPAGSEEALIADGRDVYDAAKCWECHGALGRGDGDKAPELEDDWGFPVWPANLRVGWKLKGGRSATELYLRFSTGLDGTPMPSYAETLSDEERWQLAHYVASLPADVQDGQPGGVVITARRMDGPLPTRADDPEWDAVTEVSIPLTGQATFAPRWQIPAVTDLAVGALFNDEEIALRLAWDDRFADTVAVDSARAAAEGHSTDDTYPVLYPDGQRMRGRFADAAEVMFPVRDGEGGVLPHFVYGSAGQPVDLWRWRADLQVATGSATAVSELRARGVDRPPEPHPPESQLAAGEGSWSDGRWTVVIRRPLLTENGTGEVQLRPGQFVPVAFHVWEGSNGETGMRMALSSWTFLHLREPAPFSSYLIVLLAVVVGVAVEWGMVRWVSGKQDRSTE